MSTTLSLKLEHLLPDSMEIIYNSLLDFEFFAKLHPYIKKVTLLQSAEGGEYAEYQIKERVSFLGIVKIYPKYKAKVFEKEKGKCIRYESQVTNGIFLTIDFTLTKNKNEAIIVTEQIHLKCNKLIGTYFLNVLKRAHTQFFKNLMRHIQLTAQEIKKN